MKKIVAQFNVKGFTAEQYRKTIHDLEAAGKEKSAGRLNHVAAEQKDGLLIIDVWESEEALNEFSKILVPVLLKNGVTPAEPIVLPLHNLIV
jgi:quinol monooxygenase YgiN